MKSISIVFSKSSSKTGIFSWLIMWVEGTSYSHVAIRTIDEETSKAVYYQASHTMVNSMGEEQFLSQEIVIDKFDFLLDDEVFLSGKGFAIDSLGKPYGVRAIFGLAYVQLCKFLGIKVQNPFKDAGSTYVCSQFVGAFIEKAENIDLDLDDLTPELLFPTVQGLPKIWTGKI